MHITPKFFISLKQSSRYQKNPRQIFPSSYLPFSHEKRLRWSKFTLDCPSLLWTLYTVYTVFFLCTQKKESTNRISTIFLCTQFFLVYTAFYFNQSNPSSIEICVHGKIFRVHSCSLVNIVNDLKTWFPSVEGIISNNWEVGKSWRMYPGPVWN